MNITHADLNSGPTLVRSFVGFVFVRPLVRSLARSFVRPGPGRDYYGCELGKRPIRRLFYSNYFSISVLHSQFRGTHTRRRGDRRVGERAGER